jgi:hypothetical protein
MAPLSDEERNNARTSVQVALGVIEAYHASGSPEGETLAGLERWLRDTEVNLEEKSNATTDPALPD